MQTLDFSLRGASRLPVILQSEAAECGLACLCMIANFWGHHTSLSALRARLSMSIKGATLANLMTMAERLALKGRALKLDLPHLQQLKTPCILHWDFNHFVVLKSATSSHIVIHDPALGDRRLSLADASKSFTGIALELTPGPDFSRRRAVQKQSLLSLMGPLYGLRAGITQILVLGVALQLCAVLSPFFMQWLVDDALLAGDYDLITILGSGFLLLALIQTAVSTFRSWAIISLSASVSYQWFSNAFINLMRLPLPFFEKRQSGDILSRFGSIQAIQQTLTTQLVEAILDGVLGIGTAVAMLIYSPFLTGISAIALVSYFLIRASLLTRTRSISAETVIHTAKQQSHLIQSIQGIQSIRLLNGGNQRHAAWMNKLTDQLNAHLRQSRLSTAQDAVKFLIFNTERVVVIWAASLLVLNERQLSIGMLYAFIALKEQFSQRVSSLIDKFFELRMLDVHAERVSELRTAEPAEALESTSVDLTCIPADITFENVSFRYSDIEPYILSNINLNIPAGQFTAITGPSGCGKTTLLKLLLGLLKPTEGQIKLGGIDITRLGAANISEILGVVMQEDRLFSGTIAENISFPNPHPDANQVAQAAFMAAIHDEIQAMPMAYKTLIGDLGSGLSGGQKQRILLARAIYSMPKLLVLDEATSHLDTFNEQSVNDAIKQLALTRIVVAHRPETIAMADRVIRIVRGRIVDPTTPTGELELPAGVSAALKT